MLDIKTALAALQSDGRYRIIEKYEKPAFYHADDSAKKLIATFIDVETTGLNAKTDQIIELGFVSFEYSKDGRIFKIIDEYSEYEDPGIYIPEKITQLTGITDAMVKGKTIDTPRVLAAIARSNLIIAHNATFDREFIEAFFPDFPIKPWACSIQNINWEAEGVESTKLEYLAYKNGFFFDGHRAVSDCFAGIHLLSKTLPKSGMPILKALLDDCRTDKFKIWAINAPFEAKDILRERGYRWCAENQGKYKAWWIELPEQAAIEELSFLWTTLYPASTKLPIELSTAFNRFSTRKTTITPEQQALETSKVQRLYHRAESFTPNDA